MPFPRPPARAPSAINGAAARLAQKGDLVIIVAYARMEEAEAKSFSPRVLLVDANNRPQAPAPAHSGNLKPLATILHEMPRQDDEKFSNRLETAAKARAEMLAKVKARAEAAKANWPTSAPRSAWPSPPRAMNAPPSAPRKSAWPAEAEEREAREEEERKRREEEEAKAAAEAEEARRGREAGPASGRTEGRP